MKPLNQLNQRHQIKGNIINQIFEITYLENIFETLDNIKEIRSPIARVRRSIAWELITSIEESF